MAGALAGQVALVTGASRGVGKGIALALGEAGATVYVTGRTQREGDAPLPGTIGATAAQVTQRGGRGVAVACDHADDTQVQALFERLDREQGRLDVLVNNAYAVPDRLVEPGPFWEKPLDFWVMVDVGLRSHFVASWHAAKRMVAAGRGLIVNTSSFGAVAYVHSPVYGAGKAGLDKLTFDMAEELRPHGVACVSLWLGLIRTERTTRVLERTPDLYDVSGSESQEFEGRVTVALARDPEVQRWSGKTLIGAEVARAYGLKDVDGSQPPSLRESLGNPVFDVPELARGPRGSGA